MFRNSNRRNSQKPSNELYRDFKANFPSLSTTTATASANTSTAAAPAPIGPPTSTAPTVGSSTLPTSLAEALDVSINPRSLEGHLHEIKDVDSTPRGSNEPWTFGTSGLTPSLMDAHSTGFNMFANQMTTFYNPTPTPGGTNTLYHNQAGDLHTPGYGMGLGTPLSMPTSESAMHAGHQQPTTFDPFQTHIQQMQSQQFQNANSFQMHQSQAFPPAQFTHQPSFESMDGAVGESPVEDLGIDMAGLHQQHQSPDMMFHPANLRATMQPPMTHPSSSSPNQFRYHATLNAPTAMIKHSDEIPVTYLNKGQAYTLNVVDTQLRHGVSPAKYRTFVRVSFEDEQQRQKPAACWQLWKEGRGTNEAHQRGGRLQAVEYVDSGSAGGTDDPGKAQLELQSASYDGFCVTWTPAAGSSECPISVRFNFLSTDFSHSKGVKGIPVRLCAKTEMIEAPARSSQPRGPAEVCYCKVKLFRDHGAERKLSNDIAHVKKAIDKLNQQISQLESGSRDTGKRKRSGSMAKGMERPGKVPKHRRTWSMTSVTDNGGRGSAEDDLHMKLMTLQDSFTSTRPASVLHLRGEKGDDPDQYPVRLTDDAKELAREDSGETSNWNKGTAPDSATVSPTPSNNSLIGSRKDSSMQQPTPIGGLSRDNSNEWKGQPPTATMHIQPTIPEHLQSPLNSFPRKVRTKSPNGGTVSGWIEALGVDPDYQAPPERRTKPVASFYIQPRVSGRSPSDHFYRAIYLTHRSLEDFNRAVAAKCDIDPSHVLRTYRVTPAGIEILFDDECVHEIPEGQDMTAEFDEIRTDSPIKPKREWDVASLDIEGDGELPTMEETPSSGYALRLSF